MKKLSAIGGAVAVLSLYFIAPRPDEGTSNNTLWASVSLSQPCFANTEQVADLRAGTLLLLDGYIHEYRGGTDSKSGQINRADGKLTIYYDIGFMAG